MGKERGGKRSGFYCVSAMSIGGSRKAEEGGLNVTVPALDGCFTQSETEEEAIENAKEAIHAYLEGLEKLNQIKSTPNAIMKKVEMVF